MSTALPSSIDPITMDLYFNSTDESMSSILEAKLKLSSPSPKVESEELSHQAPVADSSEEAESSGNNNYPSAISESDSFVPRPQDLGNGPDTSMDDSDSIHGSGPAREFVSSAPFRHRRHRNVRPRRYSTTLRHKSRKAERKLDIPETPFSSLEEVDWCGWVGCGLDFPFEHGVELWTHVLDAHMPTQRRLGVSASHGRREPMSLANNGVSIRSSWYGLARLMFSCSCAWTRICSQVLVDVAVGIVLDLLS
ncbi:hypothetical protein BO71DRAFT_412200 [Aspergillus ellipticus CBS 707.79]|uniref:Uncharacterized protein n=1 Tax=Aspergillus ellipticus CBS 707.79 TaxID=1448320 RepID=A0A319EJ33_9EURO|nr:hypothetical protein BO71DRAFT_412200 [Aspergillus ellipticus CBS 707.79]